MTNKIIKEILIVILFVCIFIKISSLTLQFINKNFDGKWIIFIISFITIVIHFASKYMDKKS